MPDPSAPSRAGRGLGLAGILALVGIAALAYTGISARDKGAAKLRDWTEDQAIPTVAIATLNTKPVVTSLDLPGRLEANLRAPIFARVSGYVKSWSVDISDSVKAGQTLAEVEAPDLDQQLLQARAALANAKAAARLSEVTLGRGRTLLTSSAVSQQDVDQRAADLESKQAAVNSSEANVERLQVLAGYKKITAPFDGQVTERNVPQNYAPAILIWSEASLTVPEYPGRIFPATVTASARSVDVASGTTHMQLAVDNANGELMPGAYANVHAKLSGASTSMRIPVSALIFDQRGLRVAAVGPDDRVAYKAVTIARDLGGEIEIASGLKPDDRIIAAPPDGPAEGDPVRIAGGHPAPTPVSAAAKPDSGS
jgi:membrane fusion protein (multidrug efflux system)